MPIDDAVVSAESCLKRSLDPIEKLILQASLEGQPYNVIAENSGYANVYVREVGARLWQALSEALGTKVTKKTLSLVLETTARPFPNQLDYPSGPLAVESALYIDRLEPMQQALAVLAHPGCLIRIQGARCIGKTSFLMRLLERGRERNYHIVNLSLRQLEPALHQSFNAFADWLLMAIASQLDISPNVLRQNTSPGGEMLQLSLDLQTILANLEHPLVLAFRDLDALIGEPDRLKTVCSLLTGWQEEARQASPWNKLRLVTSYTQDIEQVRGAKFQGGLELRLGPIDLQQAAQLAQAYDWLTIPKEGLTESADAKLKQLMDWVGGHPYLLALAFYHLSNHRSLSEIVTNAIGSDSIFNSHLRGCLGWLQEQPDLTVALRTVVSARGPVSLPGPEGQALEAAGLISLQNAQALPSCNLYRQYFVHHLRSIGGLPIPALEVSEIQRLEARIESLTRQVEALAKSNHLDKLSQFTNRDFFEQRVKQSCDQANKNSSTLALLLCSFDHYDVYVKAYGYIQAENVLKEIADCLRLSVEGPLENCSRYGSEQFMVLLNDYALERVVTMAERLREQVEALAVPQSIGYMGWSPIVTVSIGIANKKAEEQVAPAYLLSTAEQALVQAQRQGNNRIEVLDFQVSSINNPS